MIPLRGRVWRLDGGLSKLEFKLLEEINCARRVFKRSTWSSTGSSSSTRSIWSDGTRTLRARCLFEAETSIVVNNVLVSFDNLYSGWEKVLIHFKCERNGSSEIYRFLQKVSLRPMKIRSQYSFRIKLTAEILLKIHEWGDSFWEKFEQFFEDKKVSSLFNTSLRKQESRIHKNVTIRSVFNMYEEEEEA